jgi:hypothetical protein
VAPVASSKVARRKWRQILRGSVSVGAKEDESNTWHVRAGGFHQVTASSRLMSILKLTNRLFI